MSISSKMIVGGALNNSIEDLSDLYVPVLSGEMVWLFRPSDICKVSMMENECFVPGAHGGILGIVSLSSDLYTLLDFNLMLSTSPVVRTIKARVIFISSKDFGSPVALLVDRVLDIVAYKKSVFEAAMHPINSESPVDVRTQNSFGRFADNEGIAFYFANVEKICSELMVSQD